MWALCRKIFEKKSTGFLRRIIAPVCGRGLVTSSYICQHYNSFPLGDYIWWVSTGHGNSNNKKKRHCSWWCAVCGGVAPKMWDKPLWECVWLHLDSWDNVLLRTAPTHRNVPGKSGPRGELIFFLLPKKSRWSSVSWSNSGLAPPTVKACAWIGLHMMAQENAFRSDNDFSLDSGTRACMVAKKKKKSPVWTSGGDDCAGTEGTSSCEDYEHNVDNLTLEGSSEVISLFLDDWEVGRVASSCHLSVGLSCQEMRDVCKGSSESLDSHCFLCSK